jgi:ferredoxin
VVHCMTWKHLKSVRIVFSLLFFGPICFMFLDMTNIVPISLSNFFSSFQVLPAFVKIFFYTGFSSLGLVFVFILTVLFGRVYCSTICPLGTYQDFIIRISRRNRTRRWFRYRIPKFQIHYVLFALIIVSVLSGSVFALNLLEPFSNFGRIVNTLIKPIAIFSNNVLSFLLVRFDVFVVFPVQYSKIVFSVLGSIILFTGIVTFLSFYHGRMFCNLLCPAGALLGLISRLSLFKIVINEEGCTHCKLCEKVCKAHCIDSTAQTIDFAACVGCFNCMDACHTDGVIYKNVLNKEQLSKNQTVSKSRRKFLRSAAVPTVSAFIPFIDTTKSISESKSGFDNCRLHPVSPPGSKSIDHFSSYCTACQLCVASCPTKVLQPAFFDYGITGIFQPKMDYETSYCNYDCKICSDVCPSGAILPLLLEEKKLTQLGKAKFFKDDCIVITKKKDCGACSEHCPTKAVNMVPHEGVFLPEVKESICIGCGACEHACPTKPRKAIYVESNSVHLRAEKPQNKKMKEEVKTTEEFPF